MYKANYIEHWIFRYNKAVAYLAYLVGGGGGGGGGKQRRRSIFRIGGGGAK